ncbi:PaaI family thioesterase [Palleronia rufa]
MAGQVRSRDDMPGQSAFATVAGIETVSATEHEVVCTMEVAEHLANRNGMLHGGALMTLADNAAGTAAFVMIPAPRTNTTVESKTNFLRGVKVGDTVRAVCVPLHVGRRTMVFQITATRGDGKVAAVTTQTHMVLDWDG